MAGLGLVQKPKNQVTLEELIEKFPKKKRSLNEKTVELINKAQNDPEFNGVSLVDTMVTYQHIMANRSASMEQYMDAIRFCGLIEADPNVSTVEVYKRVFHDRDHVKKCLAESAGDTNHPAYKELTSAASRYRKSPMVIDIMAQADVPLYLMFQGERYAMAGILAKEARTAPLSKDRIAAADKFLTHVKPPENVQIEMDIGVKESSIIDDYEKAMAGFVKTQKEFLLKGGDVKAIANAEILRPKDEDVIEGEVE